MSWTKGQGNNSPGKGTQPQPPVQMYNPNQPPTSQGNQWQQQSTDNWYNQQKYWPQQDYNNQTAYYQDNYQQQNLQYNQQYVNNMPENDGWNDTWGGWGDEDNSNLQTISQQQPPPSTPPPPPPSQLQPQQSLIPQQPLPQQQQQQQQNLNYNPTATLVDSFTNDESWQWPSDDNNKDKLKRNKLETPQWSVESQVSQESSEQSESDKISRSSISQSPSISNDILPTNHNNDEPPSQMTESVATNKEILNKSYRKFQPKQEPSRVYNYNSQLVNLETLPDNSEQPDQLQQTTSSSMKINNKQLKQWPDNNEIPINDRNQYLETGQLLDIDNQVNNDILPPPGLRRMVLGQIEQDTNTNNSNGDEPPPGLVRTVLGQIEIDNKTTKPPEPLEGLHRMVPGESSSPETTLRQNRQDERSATIGADTPPATNTNQTNRSETIGGSSGDGVNNTGNGGASGGNDNSGREEVEGQNEDIVAITNSVRNLTVDNNVEVGRKQSRQESSETDEENRRKSPTRERRRDDRDRERNRRELYPLDSHRDRDRKHDHSRRYKERRYDDDTDYYKDTTDYYSDKERSRRRKDDKYRDEYDGRSLRRDKDKERRRRGDERSRDYERDPRKYYRYEDDYEERSRASSRSDSVHDHYRERRSERDRKERRHKEKERSRRYKDSRDPFSAYAQGFGYDVYSQYYQQYQYYENLRKTNPQAYAELYRKYYESGEQHSFGGTEDRASVHSGRSSANDELAKDRYTRHSYYSQSSLPHISGGYYREFQNSTSGQYGLDESSLSRGFDQTETTLNYEETTAVQRLTPAKFATAHIKASISSGKLIKILPNYPIDGQPAVVELTNLESLLMNNNEYMELKQFPGPLIKGVTHKKTIIEYCENKIKGAAFNKDEINDLDSYILMWELLILLLRQNGMVVGTDIAELLLKNHQQPEPIHRSSSVVSSISSNMGETSEPTNSDQKLKEEEVTNKFRDFLLYGSGKEALEWAMKHGLWGHALFLASKLDKRTYANVMMRFANGLTMNDPLQTLYQLLSGKVPAAVTCVADEKWGDWRPHLAMILSNPTQRPELNCKAITNLGDTLLNRGSLYSAQFCYLMAEVGFSEYGNDGAKLVLLGSNHNKTFLQFATNEAIHMTEIYEYACSLNDNNFSIPEFQEFKYLLSTRLADVGLLEKSLAYLERISNTIIKNPANYKLSLINNVALLADKLKFYDPVGDIGDDDSFVGDNLDTSRPDNSWLKELRTIQANYTVTPQEIYNSTPAAPEIWQQQQQQFVQQPQQQYQQWGGEQVQEQVPEPVSIEPQQPQQLEAYTNPYQYQDWSQQQWNDQNYAQQKEEPQQQQQQQQQSYYGSLAQNEDIQPTQQISMPNQSKGKSPYDDEPLETQQQQQQQQTINNNFNKKEDPATRKPLGTKKDNKDEGTKWFGLLRGWSLRPKNQMKLPDDKNPAIVWDQEKKKWVNTEDGDGDCDVEFKPPPKMTHLMSTKMPTPDNIQNYQNNTILQQNPLISNNNNNNNNNDDGNTPKAIQPNIFKLQKGRSLKKSYIDVFNPNGNPVTGKPPIPPTSGGAGGGGGGPGPGPGLNPGATATPQPPQLNFFIPQPIHDPNAPVDFLTPAPLQQQQQPHEDTPQMSRWSSTSSLSREVQSYTLRNIQPRK